MFRRIAGLILVGLLLAGCVTTGGVQTTLTGDVNSGCIESRAAYNGHRLACIVTGCPDGEKKTAEAIQRESKALCDAAPADTQANRELIQRLVAQQRAVGRK